MTARYAIIGDPIDHSLSPVLHGAAFQALGIDATYVRRRVHPGDLAEVCRNRLRTEYDGFNVTMPHKAAVIPLLDSVDELARTVGAVNTVLRRNGRLEGMNTDILGIRRSLEAHLNDLRGRRVALIGAGGTARSAVAALAADIAPSLLTILVRDPARAEDLVSLARRWLACPVQILRLDDPSIRQVVSEAALMMQTTPVGMEPESGRSPLPRPIRFSPSQTVFDVIYRPLETALLADAVRDGARVIGGLELFLQQGAAAFELWTGRRMPLETVRLAVLRSLRA